MTLPITCCEAESTFLTINNKTQILINHAREKTELFCYSLAVENGITELLSYEGAIKEYADKKCMEKVL
jgi:hypothetical protein